MTILHAALSSLPAIVWQWQRWLPLILVAIAILGGGWLVARLARIIAMKALRAINFPVLTERAGLDGLLAAGGAGIDTTGLLGALVAAFVALIALVWALDVVGLTVTAGLATRVALYIPRLMVALLVLTGGLYFARSVAQSVTSYGSDLGLADASLLGRLARSVVIAFVVLMVLDELRIGQGLIRDSFLILLGGVTLAASLAFGLGGRRWAARMLEHDWPRERPPGIGEGPGRR